MKKNSKNSLSRTRFGSLLEPFTHEKKIKWGNCIFAGIAGNFSREKERERKKEKERRERKKEKETKRKKEREKTTDKQNKVTSTTNGEV